MAEKSIFAGLQVLSPSDSIATDNFAALGRDRKEIDRALKIGVKTHRHDGSEGLTDPTATPSGEVIGSGGEIAGGLGISLAYTLQDLNGGETLLSPVETVSTPGPLEVPLVAPAAEFDSSSGVLLIDTYTYALTYTDEEGGETPVGPSVTVDRPPGYENGRIKLTELDSGMEAAGAKGWRLFRARGGGQYVLLATGEVGESEFIDTGEIEPDCNTHPPSDNINTTNQINQLKVTIPDDLIIEEATFINLYASLTGEFGEASLLEQFPVSSAGENAFFDSLEFADQQPPDRNRSYGGAPKIDPDTELLNFHWKQPVESVGELPSEGNEEGDVRAILNAETPTIYMYLEGEWQLIQTGGGGGAAVEMVDLFAGTELDAHWQAIVGEFPFNESEGLDANDGLVGTSEGGQIVRDDLSLRAGLTEIEFAISEFVSSKYQTGPIAKWIDKDNYLMAWRYEGTPYVEILGVWGGQEVINIQVKEGEAPSKPEAGKMVKLRLEHNPTGGVTLHWFYDGETEPSFSIERTLAELLEEKAGESEIQEGIEELLAAEGSPGVFLEPGADDITVSRWRTAQEPSFLRFESAVERDEPELGSVRVTIPSVSVTASGSVVDDAFDVELIGSGGVNVSITEPEEGAADFLIEGGNALLGQEGMGVIVIPAAEKGIERPNTHKQYTWFCKEEPENLAPFDIWIEEGP